jgi:hypothetical protein
MGNHKNLKRQFKEEKYYEMYKDFYTSKVKKNIK